MNNITAMNQIIQTFLSSLDSWRIDTVSWNGKSTEKIPCEEIRSLESTSASFNKRINSKGLHTGSRVGQVLPILSVLAAKVEKRSKERWWGAIAAVQKIYQQKVHVKNHKFPFLFSGPFPNQQRHKQKWLLIKDDTYFCWLTKFQRVVAELSLLSVY